MSAPTIAYNNGVLQFASDTPGAEFHYSISDPDIVTDATTAGSASLQAYYNVTVYASAKGMLNSRTTSAKLFFIDANLGNTGVIDSPAKRGVLVATNGDTITISGLSSNEAIEIYDIMGHQLGHGIAVDGTCTVRIEADENILIVRTATETLKVKR